MTNYTSFSDKTIHILTVQFLMTISKLSLIKQLFFQSCHIFNSSKSGAYMRATGNATFYGCYFDSAGLDLRGD